MANKEQNQPWAEIEDDLCFLGLWKDQDGEWHWEDGSKLGFQGEFQGYSNWDGNEGDPANTGENAAVLIPVDSHFDQGPWLIIGILIWVASIVIPVIVKVIYAAVYKGKVTDKRTKPFPDPSQIPPYASLATSHDFKYGICNTWCWDDCDMCMTSFCCNDIRNADTHDAVGTGRFWPLFWIWQVAYLIRITVDTLDEILLGVSFDIGWVFAGIVYAAVMTKKRQELRQRLGGSTQPGTMSDCSLWWCCPMCVVCQEARQVDEAVNTKVRCCCSTMPMPPPVPPTMVGQAYGGSMVGQPMQVVGQPVYGQPVMGQPVQQPGACGAQMAQPYAVAQPVAQPYGQVPIAQATVIATPAPHPGDPPAKTA